MTTRGQTGPVIRNPRRFADDVLVSWGTDRDVVALLRAAILAADTALTDVLIGTVVGQALAANSLIISNITASGDIAFYWNRGGNSEQAVLLEGSSGTVWLQANAGGVMLGLAAAPPAPDVAAVHIWDGTAGNVTATTGSRLVIEGGTTTYLQFLTPNTLNAAILFGDPQDATTGYILYNHASDLFDFTTAGVVRLRYSAAAFAFQEATTISTTAGMLNLDPTTNVGIATSAVHGTTVGTNALTMLEGTAPAGTGTDIGSIYVRDAAGVTELTYIDSGGTVSNVT